MHVWIDGSKFLGTWVNDVRHGMGIAKDQFGSEFVEEWQHGQRVSCTSRKLVGGKPINWDTGPLNSALSLVKSNLKNHVEKLKPIPVHDAFSPSRASQDVQALVAAESEKKD